MQLTSQNMSGQGLVVNFGCAEIALFQRYESSRCDEVSRREEPRLIGNDTMVPEDACALSLLRNHSGRLFGLYDSQTLSLGYTSNHVGGRSALPEAASPVQFIAQPCAHPCITFLRLSFYVGPAATLPAQVHAIYILVINVSA
jgi:hypothetical protein